MRFLLSYGIFGFSPTTTVLLARLGKPCLIHREMKTKTEGSWGGHCGFVRLRMEKGAFEPNKRQ